ncbi:MAG TPA: ribosome recycling factor [Candidatus Onthovicinus excrementipullorum]|nr:ribosome recycling factor [Candidatus Onthovicinus excrementipullorum]
MKEVFDNANERMNKTLNALEKEYGTIRAGRANPAVLDKITVDYYGTPTPIPQLASVSVSEARMLVIQPWDNSLLGAVGKAIQASDIGINPQNDGRVIRLTFPPLTEDRRREIVKDIKKYEEEAKVAVRSVRRDCIEKLKAKKKASEITEDDLKSGEERLQQITDKFVKMISDVSAQKEKEIMEI